MIKNEELFVICRDPFVDARLRSTSPGKYHNTFKKMKPGDALQLTPDQVANVLNSLRRHIKINGLDFRVGSIKQYPGDTSATCGRVWLLDAPKSALKCAA